jgi:hypothetical protein
MILAVYTGAETIRPSGEPTKNKENDNKGNSQEVSD